MLLKLPRFYNIFDCMKHAIEAAEKDEEIQYVCYGGPMYPTSYHPEFESIGVKLVVSAGCEVGYFEDVWADTYNLACRNKKHEGFSMREIKLLIDRYKFYKYLYKDKTFKEYFESIK